MARPKKDIDQKQVEQLAAINCSYAEMAAVLGCSEDTLERRFAGVIKAGRGKGNVSLKRRQWRAAMEDGNITMMIWLGKQNLGQRDKQELEMNPNPERPANIHTTVTQEAVKAAVQKLESEY